MKALTLVGLLFSAFLIFLGFTSRESVGNVLSNVVIIGGILVALFVVIIQILSYIKEKKDGENRL